MTAASPVAAPVETRQDYGEIAHITTCCDPDLSWCGIDISNARWMAEDEGCDCVECVNAQEADRCPKIGRCMGAGSDQHN